MRESSLGIGYSGLGDTMKFKHQAMALAVASAVSAAVVGGDPSPAEAASGCNEVQFVDSSRSAAFTRVFTVTLNAGDTITLSDNTAVAVTDTLTVGSNTQTFSTPGSASFTVTTSGPYTVTASGNFSPIIGTVTLSCVAGTASSVQQQANNAQIAITNGLRTLQNYQEWVTKGLQGSFGMTRGGDTASTRIDPAIRQARVRVETLTRRERELTEEIADASDTQRTDLEHERRDVQRQLAFAKVNAGVAGAPAYQVAAASDGTKTAAPSSFSLDACDLASCDPNDPQARKWNAWAEGRVMGLTDSIARQSTLGFAGTAGVDYKFQPWLALGFSLGVENYETRFNLPGVRSGQTGVTVLPYFGVRLTDNIFAEGFVGLTKLYYNVTPGTNITGSFDSLRVFFGGALSGVWYDGNWRIQPSILAAWGSETQNAYTDSNNTFVPAQTITFGRIGAGPEIGYTFKDDRRGWSFEPFGLAKVNVDFSSTPVYTFYGLTPVVARSGTQASGQLGGGIAMLLDEGFYLRLQASYDSIGVPGLDIWSGRIRAGQTF
jgi:hypothetical protein